ncbi:MAG: hypothetical protein ACM3X1_04295 [Ignavibacteriales bacterium]
MQISESEQYQLGLELDSLESGSDAETSRTDVVPVLFLIGSWRLSDLVPRKILLITTELAINTTTSPVNSSPYLFILSNTKRMDC